MRRTKGASHVTYFHSPVDGREPLGERACPSADVRTSGTRQRPDAYAGAGVAQTGRRLERGRSQRRLRCLPQHGQSGGGALPRRSRDRSAGPGGWRQCPGVFGILLDRWARSSLFWVVSNFRPFLKFTGRTDLVNALTLAGIKRFHAIVPRPRRWRRGTGCSGLCVGGGQRARRRDHLARIIDGIAGL